MKAPDHGRSSSGDGPSESTPAKAPAVKKPSSPVAAAATTKRSKLRVDWSDKGTVLFRVKQFRGNLQYAAPGLQDDEDVVRTTVKKDGLSLEFASARVRGLKGVALGAVQQNGLALAHAGDALKDDEDVVRAAVQNNGLAVQFASARLRASPHILMVAVRSNGRGWKRGLPPARDDPAVQRAAALQVETTVRKPVSFSLDLKSKPGLSKQPTTTTTTTTTTPAIPPPANVRGTL